MDSSQWPQSEVTHVWIVLCGRSSSSRVWETPVKSKNKTLDVRRTRNEGKQRGGLPTSISSVLPSIIYMLGLYQPSDRRRLMPTELTLTSHQRTQ